MPLNFDNLSQMLEEFNQQKLSSLDSSLQSNLNNNLSELRNHVKKIEASLSFLEFFSFLEDLQKSEGNVDAVLSLNFYAYSEYDDNGGSYWSTGAVLEEIQFKEDDLYSFSLEYVKNHEEIEISQDPEELIDDVKEHIQDFIENYLCDNGTSLYYCVCNVFDIDPSSGRSLSMDLDICKLLSAPTVKQAIDYLKEMA